MTRPAYETDNGYAMLQKAVDKIAELTERIEQLEQELSRYAGAVDVEGITDERGNGNTMLRLNTKIGVGTGQRVKVLVMKEVE